MDLMERGNAGYITTYFKITRKIHKEILIINKVSNLKGRKQGLHHTIQLLLRLGIKSYKEDPRFEKLLGDYKKIQKEEKDTVIGKTVGDVNLTTILDNIF